MKTKLFSAMAVAALLAGCGDSGPKIERLSEKRERWKAEFEPAIREACSNDVVGITRIVRIRTLDGEEHPKLWTAVATVEHVNQMGGVERIDLPIKTQVGSAGIDNKAHVYCQVDRDAMREEEAARAKARLEERQRLR